MSKILNYVQVGGAMLIRLNLGGKVAHGDPMKRRSSTHPNAVRRLFEPKALAMMKEYASGAMIPPNIKNEDKFDDATNARQVLTSAF